LVDAVVPQLKAKAATITTFPGVPVNQYDVFNGDADGICALHQWRLNDPRKSVLVTGVKRDIRLLDRVIAGSGDEIAVFDVSLDSNRNDVERLLASNATIHYFDHHFAGEPIVNVGLQATIDTNPDQCTSLLVDSALKGKFRAWAVVAAFGDNLHHVARKSVAGLGLNNDEIELLAELGELLNYNAYGDSVADLHFPPDRLYQMLSPYSNPLDFVRDSQAFKGLHTGFHQDIASSESITPCLSSNSTAAWLLPDMPWARRVVGVLSNRLAVANPHRAHALLVPNSSGHLTVSVRAPKSRPTGADEFCRGFPTGGGRKAAAGINQLPGVEIDRFLGAFAEFFRPSSV
jgi:hypothetical protein